MNKMNAPELEVVRFQSEDVIATSESVFRFTGDNSEIMRLLFTNPQNGEKVYYVTVGGELLSVQNSVGSDYLGSGNTYHVHTTYGGGIVITGCDGNDHEDASRILETADGAKLDAWLADVAYVRNLGK